MSIQKVMLLIDTTNYGGVLDKTDQRSVLPPGKILEFADEVSENVARLITLGVAKIVDEVPVAKYPDHLTDILARNAKESIKAVEIYAGSAAPEDKDGLLADLQILAKIEAAGNERKTVLEAIQNIVDELNKPDPALQKNLLEYLVPDDEAAVTAAITEDLSVEQLQVILAAEQAGKNREAVRDHVVAVLNIKSAPGTDGSNNQQ